MNPTGQENAGVISSDAEMPSGQAEIAVNASPVGRRARFKAAAYTALARCAYWSPVLVALVLFAQVSFRGLRPAMAEARRLASAEVTLGERHDRAAAENHEVAAHLAARADPIFRERQRRLRVIEPAASAPVQQSTQTDAPGAADQDSTGAAARDTNGAEHHDANDAASPGHSGAGAPDATKRAPQAGE
jgi:hypothetical protein